MRWYKRTVDKDGCITFNGVKYKTEHYGITVREYPRPPLNAGTVVYFEPFLPAMLLLYRKKYRQGLVAKAWNQNLK